MPGNYAPVNRRKYPRIPVPQRGQIEVYLPDRSSGDTPFTLSQMDISQGGVQGVIEGMPSETYLAMLRERRRCRVRIPVSEGEELTSFARIVWMAYNNQDTPATLRLGAQFTEHTTDQNKRIERFIQLARERTRPIA